MKIKGLNLPQYEFDDNTNSFYVWACVQAQGNNVDICQYRGKLWIAFDWDQEPEPNAGVTDPAMARKVLLEYGLIAKIDGIKVVAIK